MNNFMAIDLGTSNSAVAYYGPRGPEVIKVDGAETVPSVVMLVPAEDPANPWEVLVGERAIRAREKSPRSPYCFTSFKRQLGAVYNPEEATPDQMVPVGGMLHYQGPGTFTYAPEELVSYVLRHLKEAAEAKLKLDIDRVVLCVPATYNIAQRNALRKAADMAGFVEVELLDEPGAAAIAHGYQITDSKVHRVFVTDVGGGTTDTALYEIGNGLFRALGTNGAALVGGDDWDRHILSHILSLHELDHEQSTIAAQPDAMRLLLVESEKAKRRLSSDDVTEFRVEDIDIDRGNGEDIHVIRTISRERMDAATQELLDDIRQAIERTLAEAKSKDPRFTVKDVDDSIIVGGQTRVKAIQKTVTEALQKEPRADVDQELAVVLGAAVQAGIREGRLASITIENITPHSFSIETHDKAADVATEIVRKGTPYGTQATWWLSNRDENQKTMTLRLLQGDSKNPGENILVWEHHIEIEPGAARIQEIQLDVEIGPSGEPIIEVAGVVYGRAA